MVLQIVDLYLIESVLQANTTTLMEPALRGLKAGLMEIGLVRSLRVGYPRRIGLKQSRARCCRSGAFPACC